MYTEANTKMTNMEDPWELNIRRAQNGFIISIKQEMICDADSSQTSQIEEHVFQDDGLSSSDTDDTMKLKSLMDTLRYIQDYFGCHYHKHAEINLDIRLIDKEGKEIER